MPPTPTQLGRYEIREELGKGAMGVVFLARDPLIGRLVALKTFRLGFSVGDRDMDQFRARFIREAQSAGILSHPGIVTVHDVVERSDEGLAFIAMEYVRGTNLKMLLQGSAPLDLAFVSDVISQIAAALDYAHAHGVIHRDVKPANVILTGDGKVKITDFGIARLDSSNLTQEGQLLGTPNYMAPEQVMGKEVDHRADLFSLGVVLYEMLTGHKPFQGENLTQVSHRIVYEPFTPPEEFVRDLPADLRGVLEKALEKDPKARYSMAGDLARDLAAAVAAGRNAPHSRMDLSETQSVDAFAPPLLALAMELPPPLPPAPPLPGARDTDPVWLGDSSISAREGNSTGAEATLHETRVASGVVLVPPPPVAATAPPPPAPSVAPAFSGSPPGSPQEAPPAEPPTAAPAPAAIPPPAAAPTLPKAKKAGISFGPWLRLAAGAAGLAAIAAAAFLLTLSWVGPPLAKSLDSELQTVQAEVIRLRQEGLARLAAGDSTGAAMALARAEQLAPEHVGLRDLRQKAAAQAAAFAGAAGRTAEIQEGIEAAQQAFLDKRYDEAAIAAIGVLSRQPENAAAREILASVESAKTLAAPPTGRPARPIGASRPADPRLDTEERTAVVAADPVPEVAAPTGPAKLRVTFTTERAEGLVMVYFGAKQLLRESFRFKTTGFLRSRTEGGSFERQVLVPPDSGELRVYVTPAGQSAQVSKIQGNFLPGSTRRLVIDLPATGAANVQLQ